MNKEFEIYLNKIEEILKDFLPENAGQDWKNLTFGTIDECINDSHFSVLTKPCSHLISLGGKRWRPLLLVLCAKMTSEAKNNGISADRALKLTPLVEFAHTASLIHDDIEDAADTRRGQPCSHITWGTDVAINAASWLYFQAATAIQKAELSPQEKCSLYELFLTELRLLHLGQAMDIKWHRTPQLIPSVQEYTAMVRNKTGTLARLAVKTGIFAGGGSVKEAFEAGKIAEDIGVGFQILDDVTNLTTGNPGKKRGDDIVEGKKSLPVLLHLKDNPQDLEKLSSLFEQARKEGIESPAVEEAVNLLINSGAVEKAKETGLKLVDEKCRELALFYKNETETSRLIIELFESIQKKLR